MQRGHGGNPQDRAASLSQQRKLILGVKMMENKHESEINVVRDLIELLNLSPQKAGFAPRNLSLLKTWVLTLLRTHGFDSIKGAISEMSHNLAYILSFCT